MKNITLIIFGLCVFSCEGQYFNMSAKNDLAKLYLKGKVKTLYEYDYAKEKNGVPSGKRFYEFNTNGNLVTESVYNYNDSLEQKDSYIYDNNGHKTSQIASHYLEKEYHKQRFYYDDKGRMISYTCSDLNDSNVSCGVIKYFYDNSGNLIKEEGLEDKRVDMRLTFVYDKTGNMIESDYFSGDSLSYISKEEYRYDSITNDLIVWKYTDANQSGELINLYKYEEYDDKGNWLRQKLYRDRMCVGRTERKIEYYP